MKSIVSELEEPMSYYNYKKRNLEITKASDYNTGIQGFGRREKKAARFKKMNTKVRSESFVRGRHPPVSSLEALLETKNKYDGIGETIKNAKSELTALALNSEVYKVQLKKKLESKQL